MKALQFPDGFHRQVYFFLLVLLVLGFSFSRIAISVSEIGLVLNALWQGNFRTRAQRLRSRWPLLLFAIFFAYLAVSWFWGDHWGQGPRELRMQLPLLVLPLVLGSSGRLTEKELRLLCFFFVLGVDVHVLISIASLSGAWFVPADDFRSMGLFFNHIRFAITVVVALFVAAYQWVKHKHSGPMHWQAFWLASVAGLLVFLVFSQVLTGIFTFFAISFFVMLYAALRASQWWPRALAVLFILGTLGVAVFYGSRLYQAFWKPLPKPPGTEKELKRKDRENGHYVWLDVDLGSVQNAWAARGSIPFKGKDARGQDMRYTLIRYLTSKGLPKDSAGVMQLSAGDVAAVEAGLSNYLFRNKLSPYNRLYVIAWEIHHMQLYGKPVGTLTNRLYSYYAGIRVWMKRPLFGHGLGQMRQAYDRFYAAHAGKIPKNRLITGHCQYLRYLTQAGLMALLLFLGAIFTGMALLRRKSFIMNMVVAVLLLGSTMNDLFNGQLGSSLFGLFYTLSFIHFWESES